MVEGGWWKKNCPSPSTIRHPPSTLFRMSIPPYYVGLDVGGTSMKAGVVDDAGRPLAAVSLPTEAPRGQEFGLARMCETIRAAVERSGVGMANIAAIGVATPGTMDIPAGMILDPINLKPWRNVPVRRYVAETFNLPTAFQNDANAAAYGEFWAGAGRGANSMVLFTLGTGVGGGIIVNGAAGGYVVEGEHSHGGEVGHIKIEMTNPRECGCGRFGCLEAYASALAVVKRTREAMEKHPGRSSLHAARDELTARDVFTAAAAGDSLAGAIVEETAFCLAVGAMNLMHVIDPDLVVFGGGMIAAGAGFLERIRHHVRRLTFPVLAERTQIRYAELGSDAGFIGAAACGRQLVSGGR
jgi:glucokinase